MSEHIPEPYQRHAVTAPPLEEACAGRLRQGEPRIYGLFPAQVRGVDAAGEPFHVRTLLDNFSAGEFSLRLAQTVEVGAQLLVVAEVHAATVAVHGTVTGLDPQVDGASRLVISITHHRFI